MAGPAPRLDLPLLNAATEANDELTVRRILASVPPSASTAASLTAGPLPIAVRSGSLLCGLALCDAGASMVEASIDGKSMAAVALENNNAGALVVAVALGSDPTSVDVSDRPEWARLLNSASDPAVAARAVALVRGDSVPGVAHDDRFVLLDPEASPVDAALVLRQIRRAVRSQAARRHCPKLALRPCLLSAVLFALFVGGLISLVTVASLTSKYFPNWTSAVEDYMITAEMDNLNRLVGEKVLFSDTVLSVTRASTLFLSMFSGLLIDDRITSSVTQTMHSMLDTPVGVPGFSPAMDASYETSGWYICSVVPGHLGDCSGFSDFVSLPSATQTDLRRTKVLDVLHRAFNEAGLQVPAGASSGIGFAQHGGANFFPFRPRRVGLNTFRVVCDPDRPDITKQGYDPRCRPWYHDAKALPDGSVSFSVPYVFASPQANYGVTASTPVRSPTSGALIGVSFIDFPIDKIRNTAVAAPILREGYGFILAQDGSVVAHPNQVAGESESIYTLELGAQHSAAAAAHFRTKVVEPMLRQESGSTSFDKRGTLWYVSFKPFTLTGYSLALLVPESDVKKPSRDAEDEINDFIAVEILAGVGIFVVIFILSTIVASTLAKKIVRPVQHLLTVTRAINNGNFSMLDPVKGVHTNLAELQALKQCFQDMYQVIKITNSAVTEGNCEQAVQSYRRQITVFQKTGNVKVVGLCHNNLGLAHFLNGDTESAVLSFEAAIASVQDLLNSIPAGDLAVTGLEGTLASRLRNLCVVASKSDNEFLLRKAIHAAEQAAELDRRYPSDPARVAHVITALLLKIVAMTRLWDLTVTTPEALEAPLQEAERLAVGLQSTDAHLVQQRVILARAKYELVVGHRQEGLRLLAALLETGPTLDVQAATEAAQLLVDNEPDLGPVLAPLLNLEATAGRRPPIDVVFVVDASGSMGLQMSTDYAPEAPSRMKVAQRNIMRLVTSNFKAGDRVWLLPFSRHCNVALTAADAEADVERIEKVVYGMETNGYTRLWDALLMGLSLLEEGGGGGGETTTTMTGGAGVGAGAGGGAGGGGGGGGSGGSGPRSGAKTKRQRWVIGLTDGEDNASNATVADIPAKQDAANSHIILIGLGIGPDQQKVLRELVSRNDADLYLNAGAQDPEELDQAFSAAAEQMMSNGLSIEDF